MTDPFAVHNDEPSFGTQPTIAFDDLSTATEKTGEKSKRIDHKTKEITVRFDFNPKNHEESKKIALIHTQMLEELQIEFDDDIKIFDNHGKKLGPINHMKWGAMIHQSHFNLYLRHATKNRKQRYSVIHRIQTSQSLSTLRHTSRVFRLLKEYQCYLTRHSWSETEHDTIHVGHILGINPQHYDSTKAEMMVSAMVKKAQPKFKMPPFRMVYSSPNITIDSTKIRSKAYAIEIQRSDAETAIPLLKKTFEGKNQLLLGKLRYTHPKAYANGVKLQNQHLESVYIIPLVSITPDMMYYLRERILEIDSIYDVIPTNRTASLGRFHVLVDRKHFNGIKATLADRMGSFLDDVPDDALPPEGTFYQDPGLLPSHTADSSSGDNSFLSISARSFASLDLNSVTDSFDFYPSTTGAYSWADVASKPPIEITTDSGGHRATQPPPPKLPPTNTSSPSTTAPSTNLSDLTSTNTEIALLRQMISDLQSTVSQLTQRLNVQDLTSPPDHQSTNPKRTSEDMDISSPTKNDGFKRINDSLTPERRTLDGVFGQDEDL